MTEKNYSKEFKFINDRVNRGQLSQTLQEIRKNLAPTKIPPEHAVEFFLLNNEVEELKNCVRKETNGNCYFFTKGKEGKVELVGDKIHIICFYGIEGIADFMENLKGGESIANFNPRSLKKMEFEKNISFDNFTSKKRGL